MKHEEPKERRCKKCSKPLFEAKGYLTCFDCWYKIPVDFSDTGGEGFDLEAIANHGHPVVQKSSNATPAKGGWDYSKHDHSHCWESKKPPCGQKIKHFECCLCKEQHPEIHAAVQRTLETAAKVIREHRLTDWSGEAEVEAEIEEIAKKVESLKRDISKS